MKATKRPCLLTSKEIKRARRNIIKYPRAGALFAAMRKNADWWVNKSDAHVIGLIPSAVDRRAMYPSEYGCPVHGGGDEAYSFDINNPTVIKCRTGGEVYPNAEFPDGGNGWRDNRPGSPTYGQDYYFKADVTRYLWERIVLCGLVDLSYLYLLTNKKEYAHKAAIILDRIADVYPRLDPYDMCRYATVGENGWVKISNYVWEPGYIVAFAEAYDFIRDKLDEQVKTRIKTNIFDVAGDLFMNKFADDCCNGKSLQFQALAAIWAVSGGKKIKQYLVETLEDAINNGFTSDGFWMEGATTVYHRGVFSSTIDALEHLYRGGLDLYKRNKKIKKLFDYWVDMLCINKYTPSLGDAGGPDAPLLVNARYMEIAYRRYGEQKYADYFALAIKEDIVPHEERMRVYFSSGGSMYSGKSNSVSYLFLDFDGMRPIARPMINGSVNLSGGGIGILKEDTGKTALLMKYGTNWTFCSHGHYSALKIDLFGKGHELTPEMGYPEYFGQHLKRQGWISHTLSHCTVMVDRKRQMMATGGRLELFKDTPEVKLISAAAEDVYPGMVSLYKRTTALISAGAEAYAVDIFRVKGGKHHDYVMVGLGEEFSAGGLELTAQAGGTLAGEDVKFGEFFDDANLLGTNPNELWRSGRPFAYHIYEGSGYQYLYDVKKAISTGQWSATWRNEDGACLRLTMVAGGSEAVVAHGDPPIVPDMSSSAIKNKNFSAPADPHRRNHGWH